MMPPNWQYAFGTGPSIGDVFAQSRKTQLQARALEFRKEQFKQRVEAAKLKQTAELSASKERREAIKLRQQGDPSTLEIVDPDLAIDLGKEEREEKESAIKRADEALDLKLELGERSAKASLEFLSPALKTGAQGEPPTLDVNQLGRGVLQLRHLAQGGIVSPETAEQAQQLLLQMQASPEPMRVASFLGGAQQTVDLLGDEEKRIAVTSLPKNIAARVAEETGDNRHFDHDVALQEQPVLYRKYAEIERQRMLKDAKLRGSKLSVNVPITVPGNVEPEKGFKLTRQQEIAASTDGLQKLQILRQVAKPEFFGAEGLLKNAAAKADDFFRGQGSSEWAQQYLQTKAWLRGVGRLFVLDLLTAKSGKQVTDKEREFLLKAVGDPDNMTFHEYKGALNAMETVLNLGLGRAKGDLREGIDVMPEELRDPINRRIRNVMDLQHEGTLSPEEAGLRLLDIQKAASAASQAWQAHRKAGQDISARATILKAKAGRREGLTEEEKEELVELQRRAKNVSAFAGSAFSGE